MQEVKCNVTDCFLCSHCSPAWRGLVAVRKKSFRIRKGGAVFSEGDRVEGIYFLFRGAVKVHKQWVEGKELIIRFTRAGDILGHRGLGGVERYPVSATALEESVVCFIPNALLEDTLKTDTGFAFHMLHFYAAELTKAELRMRNLALMDVKGRIAEALLALYDCFGTDKNKYIRVPVTRQDIAAYAGTTYETVFKLLREWTAKAIISSSGKHIKLRDPEFLRRLVKRAK